MLIDSIQNHDIGIVIKLLDEGIDPNTKSMYNRTALMHAASWGFIAAIHPLLDHGADIDAQNKWGWTALMVACFFSRIEIVRLLLDRGADPTIIDDDGMTAHDIAKHQDIKNMIAIHPLSLYMIKRRSREYMSSYHDIEIIVQNEE